jgi:hypothetical protein
MFFLSSRVIKKSFSLWKLPEASSTIEERNNVEDKASKTFKKSNEIMHSCADHKQTHVVNTKFDKSSEEGQKFMICFELFSYL